MFTKPTVLLVGAGASAEFGLPTGVGLYEAASREDETQSATSDTRADQFLTSFWEYIRFSNQHKEQNDFRELVSRLNQSHAYSIDLFAYYNPSFAAITKHYTVWRLYKEFFQLEDYRDQFGDPRQRLARSYRWRSPKVGHSAAARNNWLGELANSWLSGAKSIGDLARNQLTFVTFNYDPIIEETFPWIVRQNERFAETPDELMPKVVHVHGALDAPSLETLTASDYQRSATRIKFISDTIDSQSDAVHEALKVLKSAARVYSVGFAFEQLNLDLLGAGTWGARTIALNYDGNTKVLGAMRKIGIRTSNIWAGTEGKVLPVGLAATSGFFEADLDY